jgi:hypothetical protein
VREHTLYDIAVKHVLATRGSQARVEMDTALNRLADELETDARKRDRIVTISGTTAFVLGGLFLANEISTRVDGLALLAPTIVNVTFGAAAVAVTIAIGFSFRIDRLTRPRARDASLHALGDPALAPVREVLRECLDGAYAVFDRYDVQIDRPIFASPLAVILFLPLYRHRNYRLPNAQRPFAEQLKVVRVLRSKPEMKGMARSGAVARNAFLASATSLLFLPRIEAIALHWENPRKGEKLKQALLEAGELANETPSLTDTQLAKEVAARLAARGMKIGLSDSTSTEWLEQVFGGTGDYGWIREYLSGDDKAMPEKRTTKRRA